MPPELPGINQIFVCRDGTFHLDYTTTTGDGTETDHRIPLNGTEHLAPVHPAVGYDINTDNYTATFYNDRITVATDEVNIPNTTIHASDCYGYTWLSTEERIKEIVRETVKELLEQEGYIIGKIPNQPSDLPVGE